MSNTITAFLETLVAASGDYNAAKVGRLSFIDAVYKDVRPEVARAGKTIQVYFPDIGAFSDQQGNDWSPADINPAFVDIVFNQRPGQSILVRDFEQWQTAVDVMEQFLDPLYKRGQEYINGQLAALVTNANFSTYSPIVGGTNGAVKVADVANAWSTLAGNKVPVSDTSDLSLLTHSDVHSAMLQDAQWYQENLVGALIAERARQQADLGVAFNFKKLWDQQCGKKSSTALNGTVANTNGSGAVVGTGTAFTSVVEVGDRLTIQSDSTATVYTVTTIADDTHLTISPVFGGSTASGKTATQAGYTCVAIHRYAIALALRPMELVNDGNTQSRLVMLKGIPFRVMLSYQHLKAGWLLSMDVGCAVKVIRPDFGVVIKV
jgi:hypothetical protein